jgi:Fur family transcriptional regulator, stress-responsive regulator
MTDPHDGGSSRHHVVCRICGATAEVDYDAGVSPRVSPPDADGFLVDDAEVTLWGMCPGCQRSHGQAR